MKTLRTLSACALAAAGFVTVASAQVQVAGTLQVNVDATTAPVGVLTYLTNSGAMGGVFIATNNNVAGVTPRIIALGGDGTRGVLLDGIGVSLRHFTDITGTTPYLPPAGLVGNAPIFSVEAWAYKSTIREGTGPVAWGNRVNGQNVACSWGHSIAWGGLSFQGGNWDHGWAQLPSAGTWHHLVWVVDGLNATIKLYRDGVLDKTAAQTAALAIAADYNILIGAQHNGVNFASHDIGVVGRVRIHDGVLTDAQVLNNYTFEVAGFVNGTPAQDLVSGPTHRYSFKQPATNNAVGLTVADTGSVPAGDAVIKGTFTNANASFDGTQLILSGGGSGTASYVDLPNNILSGFSSSNSGPGQVSIEMWVTPNASANWIRLASFGNTSVGEVTGPGTSHNGANEFEIPLQVGGGETAGIIGVAGTRNVGERLLGAPRHIVATWDEFANTLKLYYDGVQVGGEWPANAKMNAVVDVNCWLGRSAWSGDGNANASYREFRMYGRILSDAEIRRNYLVGPDVVDPATLAWNGNVNGNWDTLTQNWLDNATGAAFANGKNVQFDDAATGTTTINLAATVSPASVMVGGSKPYTFGGAGKISGSTGLTKQGAGTLTFTGSPANDFTGPVNLVGGKLVVSSVANGGSPSPLGASSADPSNLRIAGTFSYQGPAATTDRGFTPLGIYSTIEVQNSLTFGGSIVAPVGAALTKTGPGTLVLSTAGSNYLSASTINPRLQVARGTLVLDGGAGGTGIHRTLGEVWVGNYPDYGGHLVLSNCTLLTGNWLAVGRGNGSIGNQSSLRLENGRITLGADGFSTGYWANRLNNSASQTVTLNGASSIYVPGNLNFAESAGSSSSMTLNGSSWIRMNSLLVAMGVNTTGEVTIANSAVITNIAYSSIGTAAASDVGPGGSGKMTVKDNGAFSVGAEINVSDVGAAAGGSVGRLDILNNAAVTVREAYIGKGQLCIGEVNQSGGTFTGNNFVRLGSAAGSMGTLNLSGGTFGLTNATADFFVGFSGSGTLNVTGSGALNVPNNLVIGNSAGAVGTVNLDGGTITAKRAYSPDPTATSALYLNGGRLVAAAGANPNFMSGLGLVIVGAGGAKIDSSNNVITITQDLSDGGGGLTKFGTGTLTLAGIPYYTGSTLVSEGKLNVTAGFNLAGGFTTAGGTSLGIQIRTLGASSTIPSMSLGATSTLDFDLGTFGSVATAPWVVSGAVTRGGVVTVNIDPASTVLATGIIPLMQFGSVSGGSFVLGTLPPGVEATLTETATTLSLTVTKVSLPRWEGNVAGGVWDIGVTANWIDRVTALPMTYEQGFQAVFNDDATGTTSVDLTQVVSPGGVVVTNSLKNYTIGGVGRISGNAGLTKQGTGSLTLSTTNNNYAGATFIDEGGTLVSTVANNLGTTTSPLIIGNGTLNIGANNQRFGSVTLTNGAIAATGATVTAPTYTLHAGSISAVLAGGTLSTVSTNPLDVVTASALNTYTGRTLLGGGTLAVPNLGNGGAPSGVGSSSANPTNLVFAGGGLDYTGAAGTTDRGYLIDGGGIFSVANSLKLLGPVTPGAGLFRKGGPGTLIYSRPGTNLLANNSYFVSGGTLMFDGGASTPGNYLQTNRVNGDIWVGHDALGTGHMVVSNSSLNVSAWVALDRGNGTAGYASTVTLYDSVVTSGNMSMGYWNNIEGNLSTSSMRLLGNSSYTSGGTVHIGENVGADSSLTVAGTSSFTMLANWLGIGTAGKGTLTLSNTARFYMVGDYNVGDIASGNGTVNIYDNATNLCATLYVGKGNDAGPATGVVNQHGGFFSRSTGGGDWRIGGNNSINTATSSGIYNLYGGILQPNGNFQIGAWGIGTLNQSGGEAICSSYPVVGRYPGSMGELNVSGGTFTQTGTGQLLIIGEEGSGTLNVSATGLVDSRGGISVGHTATGIGLVNLNGGTLATTRIFRGNEASGQATINFNGGVLKANANNTTFMGGLVAANVGAAGAIVDSAAYNIEIAQPLLNAGGTDGGLVKLGTGVLTLSGVNTYNGLTVVSNGALIVNGTVPGAATVRAGALLGGSGTVSGVATIQAGGFISAGSGGIGVLALGTSPTLGGTVYAEVDRNAGSPIADRINVTGSIAYAGGLHIVNLGEPLQVNDTFTLFNASGYSGSFTITSFTPGQTVTWDASQLTVNGTIRVSSITAAQPPEIDATVVDNTIDISWPQIGWILQGQTNTINVGLANNWVTVPGSATTNRMIFTIDPTKGTVFFRLISP